MGFTGAQDSPAGGRVPNMGAAGGDLNPAPLGRGVPATIHPAMNLQGDGARGVPLGALLLARALACAPPGPGRLHTVDDPQPRLPARPVAHGDPRRWCTSLGSHPWAVRPSAGTPGVEGAARTEPRAEFGRGGCAPGALVIPAADAGRSSCPMAPAPLGVPDSGIDPRSVRSGDGARLSIGGQVVYECWTRHLVRGDSASAELETRQRQPRLERLPRASAGDLAPWPRARRVGPPGWRDAPRAALPLASHIPSSSPAPRRPAMHPAVPQRTQRPPRPGPTANPST
jgi:hypothetical protein